MHKKLYVVFFIVICLFGVVSIKALKDENMPLLGKVIYLDPGHGGLDGGAQYQDIYEKDINLKISLKLQEKLLKEGAIVYLTRDGNYDLAVPNTINRKRSDLSRRSNIINNSLCDLFLSIHLNSETTGLWKGPQVFYDDIVKENKEIAELFQTELNKSLNGKRKVKQVTDLYLQKRVNRPGVLVEVGFLSNANDRYLLKQDNYQDKVAAILTKTIKRYFESTSF